MWPTGSVEGFEAYRHSLPHEENHRAHRNARGLRRHARPSQGRLVRLPRHQHHVEPDRDGRDPRLRRGRVRRHHPGLHGRCRVRLGVDHQGHGDRFARPRRLRARGGQELPGQHRPAHRPLPQGQARRLRAPAHRGVGRAGQVHRPADLPEPHVGRLGGAARREPRDRPGAARARQGRAHHPRGRDRCRRWRGGRCRQRDQRAALHDHRRRPEDRGRARPRRERPLHGRAHLRQRARRLQAGQRQAAPGDPQAVPGRHRRRPR